MAESLVYIGSFVIIVVLILAKEIYDVRILKLPEKKRDIIMLAFFLGLFVVSAALAVVQELYDVIHFTAWRARSLLWVIAAASLVYLLKSIRDCYYLK